MDLLLLAPYDIHNPLPTLFEVFALEELQAALRNAMSVGVFNLVDRAANYVHPSCARVQPFLPEIELLLTTILEARFLNFFDATACQRLFGLKLTRAVPRGPVISKLKLQPPSTTATENIVTAASAAATTSTSTTSSLNLPSSSSSNIITTPESSNFKSPKPTTDPRLPMSLGGISFDPVSRHQRLFILLESVLAPYISRRLEHWYTEWTDDTPEGRERRQQAERTISPWRLAILRIIAKVYPILRAVLGVSKVAVWLGYMANRIPYPSLVMWLSKTILTRRTVGDEALQRMSAGSNRLLMLLTFVITWTIVGFEVADWWYRDGGRSSVLKDRRGLPPPHIDSLKNNNTSSDSENVPKDGICFLCKNSVVNPCVNIATGYVFCYPCLAKHVREHGTCPVKPQIRVTPRHIRRLFIE